MKKNQLSQNPELSRAVSMFEGMSDGFSLQEIIYDHQGQAVDYRILKVNPAWRQMFGAVAAEVEGKLASEVCGLSDLALLNSFHQFVSSKKPDQIEIGLHGKVFSVSVFSTEGQFCAAIFREISGSKTLEIELKRKQQEQENLIAALPDIIMHFDDQGRHLFVSENVINYGLPAAGTFIGKTHREMGFPVELCDFWEHAISQPFLTQEAYLTEFEIDMPDGHSVTFKWRLSPSLIEDGKVKSVLAVARDITESKKAQVQIQNTMDELEQERGFLKTLIHTLPDLVWLKDLNGVYMACNPAFEEFFGACEQEIIGKTDFDYVSREQAQFFRDNDQRAIDKGKSSVNEEWLVFASDGHKALMETTKTPMRDRTGKVFGVLGIAHDITERVLSEARIKRFNHLINHSSDGIFVIRAEDAGIVEANKAAYEQLGYTLAELKQKHLWDISDRITDRSVWDQYLPKFMQSKDMVFETVHCHSDGSLIPVEVGAHFVEEADGNFFIAVARDISERKKAEQQILESGQRYQEVLSTTLDGFVLVDTNLRVVEVNDAYCRLSGYSRDELLSMKVSELDACMGEQEIQQRMQHIVHQGPVLFETEHKRKDGSVWPVEISTSYSSLHGGCVFSFVRDISGRKEAENKIEFMAFHDVLTGLPNRQLLTDRLKQSVALSNRSEKLLAVCYLDIDGFKPVNDRFGHETGDQLLILLAERLSQDMRDGDTLARLGGDEFVVLLNGLDNVFQAEEIAQRLLSRISDPFEIADIRIFISSSLGLSIYPLDNADPDTLIRHADQAMYSAKNEGKNTYRLYDQVQDQQVHDHRRALTEIEEALRENQLTLFFQPRINLNNGELSSAEALIRWHHPDRGLLLPGEFLPVIQGSPIELALDEWVLKTSLDQHMRWRSEGLILPISVNLSPRSMQQGNFTGFLESLLQEFPDLEPGHLELEVLESIAIGDLETVSKIMLNCRALGVKFALDDFGTGFSSLTYFHHLPINIVKIDRQFVQSMLHDSRDHGIVEGVVRLAQALKRPVVAEGVQSIETAKELLRLGCEYAQGFGIAKPMPAEEINAWINAWTLEKLWHQLH